MKQEFSEVLLPSSQGQGLKSEETLPKLAILHPSTYVNSGKNDQKSPGHSRWLGVAAILLAICVCTLTTTLLLRYEAKFTDFERRIESLELELDTFYTKLEEPSENHDMDDLLMGHYDEFMADPLTSEPEVDGEYLDSESGSDESGASFGKIRTSGVEIETKDGDITINPKPVRTSRNKRQVPVPYNPDFGSDVERNEDGVPIVNQSYLDKVAATQASITSGFGKSDDSTGLRIYEGLVATRGKNEPRSADFTHDGSSGVRPYHRHSAAWSEREARRRGLLKSADGGYYTDASGNAVFVDDFSYTKTGARPIETRSGSGLSPSQYPTPTYTRASRVAQTDDATPIQSKQQHSYPPNMQAKQHSQYPVPVQTPEPQPPAHVQTVQSKQQHSYPPTSHPSARTRAIKDMGDEEEDFTQSRAHLGHVPRSSDTRHFSSARRVDSLPYGPRTVAAHFVADVSNYTMRHRHYEGNGRLRNADGIFEAWKFADWMNEGSNSKSFSLSPTGVVTVREGGIYYLYAQIHYLDEHDTNSFQVQVNAEPFLQCTTMTETYRGEIAKSNSCHTSGLIHLRENDRIMIRDIETNRYSIFRPEKSFFGLMRIGDVTR